jgi:hypothetical protein
MFLCSLCASCFSDKEKLDEHQWLCSLRKPSNMHSYFCRSCNRQFVMEDDCNKHEFLCSLKLPPGSCFLCQFCGVSIGIHSHASFVQHEKHCSLNPAAAVASSVLRRHRSTREYDDNKLFSYPFKKLKKSDVPLCVCPVDPDRCVVSWSHSSTKPSRKYYRCSKFNKDE